MKSRYKKLHRLKAIKSAHAQIADLIMDLDVLDSKLRDNPNMDYSASIVQGTDNLQNVKSIFACSTIASDHRVRTEYRACSFRIVDIASFYKVPTFTSDSLSTTVVAKRKEFNYPRFPYLALMAMDDLLESISYDCSQ